MKCVISELASENSIKICYKVEMTSHNAKLKYYVSDKQGHKK
jgi:hypothetical protein